MTTEGDTWNGRGRRQGLGAKRVNESKGYVKNPYGKLCKVIIKISKSKKRRTDKMAQMVRAFSNLMPEPTGQREGINCPGLSFDLAKHVMTSAHCARTHN